MHEDLNEEMKELLDSFLKHPFYYLIDSENIPNNMWRDGNGNLISMGRMGIEHLTNCIHLIDRDLNRLDAPPILSERIRTGANNKRKELKNMIKRKIADIPE